MAKGEDPVPVSSRASSQAGSLETSLEAGACVKRSPSRCDDAWGVGTVWGRLLPTCCLGWRHRCQVLSTFDQHSLRASASPMWPAHPVKYGGSLRAEAETLAAPKTSSSRVNGAGTPRWPEQNRSVLYRLDKYLWRVF